MNRSAISKIFLALFVIALIIAFASNLHQKLLRVSLERVINHATYEFLTGSVRIEKASIDAELRLRIENLTFNLQTDDGPVPIRIREVISENSLLSIVKPGGLMLSFEGAHTQSSRRSGVSGSLKIWGIQKWKIRLETDALDIDVGDLAWLNPTNLRGSSGLIEGGLTLEAAVSGEMDLAANFQVKIPGGNLQGKLFGLLTPYLPAQAMREAARQLAFSEGLVRYQTAELNLNLVQSNQLKIVLKILIPDYNFHLNLNLIIRLEDQNSIMDLAQLVGIIKTS